MRVSAVRRLSVEDMDVAQGYLRYKDDLLDCVVEETISKPETSTVEVVNNTFAGAEAENIDAVVNSDSQVEHTVVQSTLLGEFNSNDDESINISELIGDDEDEELDYDALLGEDEDDSDEEDGGSADEEDGFEENENDIESAGFNDGEEAELDEDELLGIEEDGDDEEENDIPDVSSASGASGWEDVAEFDESELLGEDDDELDEDELLGLDDSEEESDDTSENLESGFGEDELLGSFDDDSSEDDLSGFDENDLLGGDDDESEDDFEVKDEPRSLNDVRRNVVAPDSSFGKRDSVNRRLSAKSNDMARRAEEVSRHEEVYEQPHNRNSELEERERKLQERENAAREREHQLEMEKLRMQHELELEKMKNQYAMKERELQLAAKLKSAEAARKPAVAPKATEAPKKKEAPKKVEPAKPQPKPARKKPDYNGMNDETLWRYMQKYLELKGVDTAPVKKDLVVAEFGSQNVKRMLSRGFLMAMGNGFTCG